MTRSPTPRPPVRYSSNRRPPRPARPSHLARRQRRNPLWLALAAVVLIAAVAGVIFWQTRQARATNQLAEANVQQAAVTPATLTPTVPPTATKALVSSGAVPGATGAPQASEPGITPEPQATAQVSATVATLPPTATQPAAITPADAAPTATENAAPTSTPAASAVATADAVATTATDASALTDGEPDLAALTQAMLALVNADRASQGLTPVSWDTTAASAGQQHAEEMAELGYMSHWNLDGYGPEHRYSQAGGLNYSQENVYRLVHRWEDGTGAPIEDWDKVIRDAEAALMNSPGHRANILAPAHTHLGIGIAYKASTGTVSISQEFVNRYVEIEPLPRRARPGDRIIVRGQLLPGSSAPLVNIAYEPFPSPMTLEELNQTGTYTPRAEHLTVPQTVVGQDGRFYAEYVLDKAAPPGLYHVLLWVDNPVSGEKIPAVDAVIEVNQ
jgi:uncharacterized protein YkwD